MAVELLWYEGKRLSPKMALIPLTPPLASHAHPKKRAAAECRRQGRDRACRRARCPSAASFAWLNAVLSANQLDPKTGMLVRLSEVPEQEGNLTTGLWLTDAEEFWEFSVVLSRNDGTPLAIERFCNVTSSVLIERHGLATGSSFGFLALEVLREARSTRKIP